MYKTKKSFILILVIVGMLLFGISAGAVSAQNGPGPGQDILARVAKILGINQQTLADAFKKAQTEIEADRLAQLVKDGKITQQQADQLKAWQAKEPANADPASQAFQDWLKSRPDVPALGPRGGPPPNATQMLDKLVQDGKITQQQADQLKAWEAKKPKDADLTSQAFQDWLKSRPDVQLPKPPGPPFPPPPDGQLVPPATK